MKQGCFDKIIAQVKRQSEISESLVAAKDLVRQRCSRRSLLVSHTNGKDGISFLLAFENMFLRLMI